MNEKFTYFDTTKRSAWNICDAFGAFQKVYPDLTIEQQLTKFHEQLKKENNKVVNLWLKNWASFYKQAEKAKTMPTSTSNSSSINIDMKESTNHGFSFRNVNNFYDVNHKKRELEDYEFENPPVKRYNSAVPSTEALRHVNKSDSLSESLASDCANDQPADLATDPPTINSQDDIWACWRLHLNDNSLHKCSLERLGIIQCGRKIQYRDCYPSELYNLLIYDRSTSVNPVSNNAGIFDPIFDETSDKSLMSKKLYQISYEDKQNPQVFTVASVLEILMKSVFAGVCVTDEEANYSHYVIWPLLDTIIATVDKLKFHCGEYRSKSVDKEFSRRNIHSNEHYKSDGCISTLIDGVYMELVLLEVSGPFKLNDESRFVKDHVKAGYGLVAMLNKIVYTYNFASFNVLTTVRIFFLHAKKNKL